jgi:hypothetical protein
MDLDKGLTGSDDVRHLYESGVFAEQHGSQHIDDGPGKALDVWSGLEDSIAQLVAAGRQEISICEVGCGTGVNLESIRAIVRARYPQLKLDTLGIDIAGYALDIGRKEFPANRFICQDFLSFAEKFDIVLFSDVLEHLENPFAFMRHAGEVCSYMVVRQPLQGNFGMFTKNLYPHAIEQWGHIQFFNFYNFQAVAAFCGWKPSRIELLPPWLLKTNRNPPARLKSILTKWNPRLMSMLTSGFYLTGSFARIAVAN